MKCHYFCKRALHYLAWIAIIGNIFLILLTAFWLYYPYQLPYVEQPIEIENPNKEIRIGEPILMTIHVSKPNDIVPVSQHNITCNDGNLVTLTSSARNLPKGEYTINSSNYILPPKVLVGSECQFNFINVYQLNPIRTETVKWSSEQFKVLPKE